jgi:hypothetical protein
MADFDYMGYNQKKRAAGSGYASKQAANTYAQFLSQQRGARKKFDIQQGYEKQTPKIVGSFTKRGLAGPGVQSGIYQKGLTDFAQQNFRDLSDAQSETDQEAQRLQFEEKQNTAEYDQQIAELEAQKQASIAQAAATLSAFKPFLS